MASVFNAVTIGFWFTQKMGGCQSRSNPLHGSHKWFDPVYLHKGGQWKRIQRKDPMSEPPVPMWQCWAQFRFSVIGELLSCPPQKGQLQKAIARMAEKNYQHPTEANRRISISASTIERWYYKAKSAADPIATLGRKPRCDAGIRWSMPDSLLSELKAQYAAHPRWNVQLHYDNLVALVQQHPQLKPVPSYKTILRCMRDNGWLRSNQPVRPSHGQRQAAERCQRREVRSFEVTHVHGSLAPGLSSRQNRNFRYRWQVASTDRSGDPG